jgi:hypothetical protein
MRSPLVLVLLVATIAVAVVIGFGLRPWAPSAPPPEASATRDAARPAVLNGAEAAPAGAARSPAPAAPPVMATAPFAVLGRCLTAGHGTPLPHVVVRLERSDDGQPLAEAKSGGDGGFRLQIPLPAPTDVRLVLQPDDRAGFAGERRDAVDGQSWDLGEIPFAPGGRLSGEVVDANGAPSRAVELLLVQVDRVRSGALTAPDRHEVRTGEDGKFATAEALAPGQWWFVPVTCGGIREPRTVQIEAADAFVRIVVDTPDPEQAITGRVVDQAGLPVEGVLVTAQGEGSAGSARTDFDGRFTVPRARPAFDDKARHARLQLVAEHHELVRPAAGDRVPWGSRDVELLTAPRLAVELSVRAPDGGPAPDGVVLLTTVSEGQLLLDVPRRQVVRLSPGRFRLDGLRRVPHRVWFVPRDAALAPAGPLGFVPGEAAELTLDVPRAVPFVVRVLDAGGEAVADSTVTLVRAATSTPTNPERPAPLLPEARAESLRNLHQVALARGATDADGRVAFALAPGLVALWVSGTTHHALAQDIEVTAGGEQVVTVTAAPFVRGRLGPAAALATLAASSGAPDAGFAEALPAVVALAIDQRRVLVRAPVAADGTFRLGPLPAQPLRLEARFRVRSTDWTDSTVPFDLGELDGRSPPTGELVHDLSDELPVPFAGSVHVDGAPIAHDDILLARLGERATYTARVRTDGGGRFRGMIAPGTYRVQVAVPMQPGPGHVILPLAEPCTIARGGPAVLHVAVMQRTLRLTLRDRDARPLADRPVTIVSRTGWFRPGRMRTDANGVLVVRPAPQDAFELIVDVADGDRWRLGPLQLPAGDAECVLEQQRGA